MQTIVALNDDERLVEFNWHYFDDDYTSGTWLFAVKSHVADVEQTLRDAMAAYEADEDDDFGCPNWGDARNVLDLDALGIRDVTPIVTEVYEVDHDECLNG